MGDMFKGFEKEFQDLVSSVQNKISESELNEHPQIISLKRDLHQAEKALKQMELEVVMMPSTAKGKLQSTTKSYRSEWQNLMNTLKDSEKKFYDTRNQHALMGSAISEESMNNSNQLLSQNAKLESGVQVISTTEVHAVETMNNLKKQREQLERMNDGARELKSSLVHSDKLISKMRKRGITNKIILGGVFLLLVMSIVLILYLNY